MAARASRRAPTYFTSKSHLRISSSTVSMGPMASGGAAGEGGAVDENMESAEGGGGLLDAPVHLLGVSHVEGEGIYQSTGGVGDFAGRSVQFVLGSGDDDNVGALPCEFHCDGLADAASTAGDEGFFVRES